MTRKPGPVPKPPKFDELVRDGVARDRAQFASRLGTLRERAGWTYQEFAKVTGMNPTYLKRVEHGQTNPGLDQLLRFARVLRCTSLEQLFGPMPTESMLAAPASETESRGAPGCLENSPGPPS